jgi:hypothetical protein
MKKPLMLLVVVMLSGPALARDMIDEKTHDYTPYGLAIAMVAGAQVNEMRCNKKGQIDLAIAKAQRLGVPIDVNDKEDFAYVLFQATDILKRLNKEGVTSWCKKHSALIEQLLKEP